MFEQELKNLGLSEKETLVYLASLELGPSSILEISRKGQISRTSTYDLIKSLMGKGLMSECIKGKRRLFAAEAPEKLLGVIRFQKRELVEKEKELQRILPELNTLVNLSSGRAKVRFYEGKEGIRSIREDILRTKDLMTIEEFVPLDESYKVFPPHARDHRHPMAKKIHVTERMIYTSKQGPVLPSKEGPIKRRFVLPKRFPYHTEITIYGNKVALASHGRKLLGVIIESEDVANSLRALFDLAWKAAVKDHQV